jgi:hypothetical protein
LALAGNPGWGFFLMGCAVQAASSPTSPVLPFPTIRHVHIYAGAQGVVGIVNPPGAILIVARFSSWLPRDSASGKCQADV